MRALRPGLACAVVSGLLIAGAGPAPDGRSLAAFQSAAAQPAGLRACTLFTQAEIKKLYGSKWRPIWDQLNLRPDESPLNGGGSECEMVGLYVQLDAVPVARFEANRQAYLARTKFEKIAGVGDEAWFFEQSASQDIGVYARAGEHVYVLTVGISPGETAASLRPVVIALGQAAAAKLR